MASDRLRVRLSGIWTSRRQRVNNNENNNIVDDTSNRREQIHLHCTKT